MEKKLLKRVGEMTDGERDKLRELLKDSKSADESKTLNWMYKDKVDNEEYLLGRRIEKTMVVESEPNTDVPGALFSEVINRRSELDMQLKMREDPLYMIRKKEEDAKRRLLENPIRMKQLQKVIDEQKKKKKSKDKTKKKKKDKKRNSSNDSDDELLRKYLSIVEQKKSKQSSSEVLHEHQTCASDVKSDRHHRISKQASDNGVVQTNSKQGKKHHESESTDDRKHKRREPNDRKHRESEPVDSRQLSYRSDHQTLKKDKKQTGDKKSHQYERHNDDRSTKRKRKNSSGNDSEPSSKSCSPRLAKPEGYGLIKLGNQTSDSESVRPSLPIAVKSPPSTTAVKAQPKSAPKQKRKLTAEEMERKRREMMLNAQERDEQRHANVEKYRSEDEKEQIRASQQLDSHDTAFVKPLIMKHAAQSSVEDRIKRNVYNIQRTNADLDRNFAARH